MSYPIQIHALYVEMALNQKCRHLPLNFDSIYHKTLVNHSYSLTERTNSGIKSEVSAIGYFLNALIPSEKIPLHFKVCNNGSMLLHYKNSTARKRHRILTAT